MFRDLINNDRFIFDYLIYGFNINTEQFGWEQKDFNQKNIKIPDKDFRSYIEVSTDE